MQGKTAPTEVTGTATPPMVGAPGNAPSRSASVATGTTEPDTLPPPSWFRRHLWHIVAATLAALAIAAGILAAYLWDVNEQWQARSTELTDLNHALADDLATEQVFVLTQKQQLELLREQRDTLQSRVLDLANTVNQSGDSAASAQQQIALMSDLLATASAVNNGLNRCIDGQAQLVTYLKTPDAFDPAELNAFKNSVDELCAAAVSANVEFQQQLTP